MYYNECTPNNIGCGFIGLCNLYHTVALSATGSLKHNVVMVRDWAAALKGLPSPANTNRPF